MQMKTGKTAVSIGRVVLMILVLFWVGPTPALAIDLEGGEKKDPINWAFAVHLGTGIYSASGRAVQVYTLPFSYTFRDAKDYNWGFKVKFPVTFGLYDFDFSEFFPDLSIDVQTLSILPGVEFEYPVNDYWSLMPFADLGIGKDFSGGDITYIYSTGIKSLVIFPWKVFECRFGNKFLFAGYDTPEANLSDNFRSFETGLDLRHPLWFTLRGHPMNWSVYYVNYLYSNLEFVSFLSDDFTVDVQNEFGVTVGTSDKFWWSGNPRLGLGYRFGPNFYAIRIVFGMPF